MNNDMSKKLYVENEYGYKHQHADYPDFSPEEKKWLKANGVKDTYEFSPGVTVPMHPMCVSCQARHILKYKNHPDVNDGKPFRVNCKGVPAKLPTNVVQGIKKYATEKNVPLERATKIMKSTLDPVSWIELMLGFDDTNEKWRLRWYQKEQLKCNARRLVLREGRRTGKTFLMSLKLIYLIFNHFVADGNDDEGNPQTKGPDIIVVTPFQAQLLNIFNEIERLIKKNSILSSDVTTSHAGSLYVKTPYFRMEFRNGGSISGFVTGVELRQDGAAGGSLRGQSGDIIYIDEMDMIQPDILDKVIIPILATNEDTIFYATSTPIGKAGKFYDLCKNRPDFKEDYLPTTVLPHWEAFKPELDYSDSTDDAFISEYMAEFIESNSGVFKAGQVYDSMKEYTYEDSGPRNSAWWTSFAKVGSRAQDTVTVIGIDWNKNAGTEFVVVTYDRVRNWWWVAEAVNVSASKFTGVKFKEEVLRLNFKWKPDFIYADEGYGHHIIDDLMWEAHRISTQNPVDHMAQQTAKLGDRLKKFNFSKKVQLNDPVTGKEFERTGKEFLVENAVRVFETGRISFPSNDSALRAQLLNYVVLRRHVSTGKPIYGMRSEKIGDHRLDALMLALGGLFLEKHPLYSKNARQITNMPTLLKKSELEKRANPEDGGALEHGIPGIHLEKISFIRGNNEEEDARVHKIQALEKENKAPDWKTNGRRGDFPTSTSGKQESVFEQLWNRAKSSNGFETDTRPLYEGVSRKGGLFARKRGRLSKSRRSW